MTAEPEPPAVMAANRALDRVAEHVVEPVEWVRRAHERGYWVAPVVVVGGGAGVVAGDGGGVGAGLGFGFGVGFAGAVVVVVLVVVVGVYDGT